MSRDIDGDAAIRASHLSQCFKSLRVLDDVSLTVPAGSVYGILGPNGAGKSTLVDICTGSLKPNAGTARVLGFDPISQVREVRPRLGLVLQESVFPAGLLVRDVISCWKRYDLDPPETDLEDVFKLKALEKRRVQELSGGERRKLDLYLAMMGNPLVLVLDEPTTGLDPLSRREVWNIVLALAQGGTTVLLTSHYLDEVERLCSQLSMLVAGRVAVSGTPREVARSYSARRSAWIVCESGDAALCAHMQLRDLGGRPVREDCRLSWKSASPFEDLRRLWGVEGLAGRILDAAIDDYSLEAAYENLIKLHADGLAASEQTNVERG